MLLSTDLFLYFSLKRGCCGELQRERKRRGIVVFFSLLNLHGGLIAMAKLPEKKSPTYWLFADMVKDGATLEFSEFKPDYKSRNNNSFPVVVLLGAVEWQPEKAKEKQRLEGEFLCSYWNINCDKIVELKGDNTDTWGALKLTLKPDPNNSTKMVVVEVAQ